MRLHVILLVCAGVLLAPDSAHSGWGSGWKPGLNKAARKELQAAGVTKYMGEFEPAASIPVGDGWIKHTFDPNNGDGPICIAGTPYSVFTRARNPKKLMVFMQGGGACWQDFYFCNVLSEAQEPGSQPVSGVFVDSFNTGVEEIDNPLSDWSVVYMPYCDGSVFSGDNDVYDPAFGQAIGIPQAVVRFHRGLRNATAGMDVAKSTFPKARRILVTGSSAGGVGASSFAPFLARLAFGNNRYLSVINDAGPVATNLLDVQAVQQRASDWQFGQFYPASCTDCDDQGQGTAIIDWRLDNDRTITEAFYSTDGDATNRFFLKVPTQELYRALLLFEHGKLHWKHPFRYRRFIRSGDDSHTALQSPLFYVGEADGVPLYKWVRSFLIFPLFAPDIVEDFVPLP